MTTPLRESGVYRLPDGTGVVASEGDAGGYALYTFAEWDFLSAADYELDPAGRVTFQGEPTGWTVTDLVDTGVLAEEERT